MLEMIVEMFSYNFIIRAFVVGVLVSLCAALLGVTLVLKRYSMIGDGLSHVGFGALAVAAALNVAPLEVAVPVIIIAAFFLLRISENSKINGDAAIAIISSTALAIGVFTASLSGLNTDLNSYLFGSILATSNSDAIMCVVLAVIVIVMYFIFYNRIFAVTFDEGFAKATGLKPSIYNMVIALLTALTIVIGMRIMGTLLISALIIFPAITSMRLCKRFKSVIICSGVLSVICFFAGMLISYNYDTPTGASVVLTNCGAFLVFWLISIIKVKITKSKTIKQTNISR
ncbi:MAG: metal ABC transporter permease [Ruminococcus sp.]|nr:metal ABC transporter permease [Ruminococcus sp.]